MRLRFAKIKYPAALSLALFMFGAATFVLVRLSTVMADNDRVFELRIYHVVAGKLPVMESWFRDKTSKILARHNLHVVGYWVADDAPDNSFVFLFSHESREAAKKNWEAFRLDPSPRSPSINSSIVFALASMTLYIATFPAAFRTAIEMLSLCTSIPIYLVVLVIKGCAPFRMV